MDARFFQYITAVASSSCFVVSAINLLQEAYISSLIITVFASIVLYVSFQFKLEANKEEKEKINNIEVKDETIL